ncbi:helix-turn-helix domain-containing protein [Streptomyces sp. NPDC002285]
MLDFPYELVEHVSWLVYAQRRELRSPWRKLSCFKQALLVLAHLRKNETLAQVGAGFGVFEATTWRYVDETIEVLALWTPGLHEALAGLGRSAGWSDRARLLVACGGVLYAPPQATRSLAWFRIVPRSMFPMNWLSMCRG